MNSILPFIQKHKYEFLLVALVQHLFIGIFVTDLPSYTQIIWPINMIIIGQFYTVVLVGIIISKFSTKPAQS